MGQIFLHDGNQLRRIVALAALQPGDRVLEIGPGLGPLTELLLASGAQVCAIEKDARLARMLQERLGQHPALQIIHADAMDWIGSGPSMDGTWAVRAPLTSSICVVRLVVM